MDGSSPCSTFSINGSREKAWGKEKIFREGQTKQTLNDLFFYFIELANKLKPKIVVGENVKGLILGNAKGYVKEIMKKFDEVGYRTDIFVKWCHYGITTGKRKGIFYFPKKRFI